MSQRSNLSLRRRYSPGHFIVKAFFIKPARAEENFGKRSELLCLHWILSPNAWAERLAPIKLSARGPVIHRRIEAFVSRSNRPHLAD